MLRVGLTGGLASGKSFVGRAFEQLGCYLIRADEIGHQVLARGGDAYEPVVRAFGGGILDEAGEIDRKALAEIVFQNAERLTALNKIIHPLVIEEEERLMRLRESAEPSGIAMVEAAILIETGSYRRLDRLIVVACPEWLQIQRAMKRDGSTREQVESRLQRQMPLSEKVKYADYVIDTSSTKEDTLRQTRQVFESLRSLQT